MCSFRAVTPFAMSILQRIFANCGCDVAHFMYIPHPQRTGARRRAIVAVLFYLRVLLSTQKMLNRCRFRAIGWLFRIAQIDMASIVPGSYS
jgi:hypothetical protein